MVIQIRAIEEEVDQDHMKIEVQAACKIQEVGSLKEEACPDFHQISLVINRVKIP